MHDPLGTAGVVVIVVFWVACVAYVTCARTLQKHLRCHHPTVWRKLGFRPDDTSLFVDAKDEKRVGEATMELLWFLRRGEHERLEDPRLIALVLRQQRLTKVALLLVIVLIVGALLRP